MKDADINREKTTQEITVPAYLSNFSNFGLLDVELPDGFADMSNRKEACPRFENLRAGVGVWVNFKRIGDRNELVRDKPRFWVYLSLDKDGNKIENKTRNIVFESDDWDEVLGFMGSYL